MNKRGLKWLLAAAVALVMAVTLIRTLAQVRQGPAQDGDEDDEEEAIKAPSRVSVQNGQTVITLDGKTQSRAGIIVAPLEAIAARQEIACPAMVLSAQDLVTARNNYVAALTRLEKVRAGMEVARQESDRLKALYQDNQNASQKALQSAQGTLRSLQADAQAARQDLALQAAALRQSWGGVISQWVVDDPPGLERVFDLSDVLVQVTMPAGELADAPETVFLEIPGPQHIEARRISSLPRVDPRIQGMSFLYVTPNHAGLAPGLNVIARLHIGRVMRGVLVPRAAVVWWQGTAWVYQSAAPGRFVRRQVNTEAPVAAGYLGATGFSPGERIVVRGAQALLSEEFRFSIQPED